MPALTSPAHRRKAERERVFRIQATARRASADAPAARRAAQHRVGAIDRRRRDALEMPCRDSRPDWRDAVALCRRDVRELRFDSRAHVGDLGELEPSSASAAPSARSTFQPGRASPGSFVAGATVCAVPSTLTSVASISGARPIGRITLATRFSARWRSARTRRRTRRSRAHRARARRRRSPRRLGVVEHDRPCGGSRSIARASGRLRCGSTPSRARPIALAPDGISSYALRSASRRTRAPRAAPTLRCSDAPSPTMTTDAAHPSAPSRFSSASSTRRDRARDRAIRQMTIVVRRPWQDAAARRPSPTARRCACRPARQLELEIDRIDAKTFAPCFIALRMRAPSSGISLRGLQPTSSDRVRLLDIGNRHRERTRDGAVGEIELAQAMVDVLAAQRAHELGDEMAFLVRRRRMHERAELAARALFSASLRDSGSLRPSRSRPTRRSS